MQDLNVSFLSEDRCPKCWVRRSFCYCGEQTSYVGESPPLVIHLLMHVSEIGRSSNTGGLIARTLPFVQVHVRGAEGQACSLPRLDPAHTAILFPGGVAADSIRIDERPRQLVVPDGTWRQARRMVRRLVAAQGLRCVSVRTTEACSSYSGVRKQAGLGRFATAEALATLLETWAEPLAATVLRQNFKALVRTNLRMRGIRSGSEI